jgi:hypothetical protein
MEGVGGLETLQVIITLFSHFNIKDHRALSIFLDIHKNCLNCTSRIIEAKVGPDKNQARLLLLHLRYVGTSSPKYCFNSFPTGNSANTNSHNFEGSVNPKVVRLCLRVMCCDYGRM